MGDWMTVTIEGHIDPADVPAAQQFIETGDDWDRFHCLSYFGPSLAGLGRWIPDGGGDIRVVGNLSERNYGDEDVAETLTALVAVAPSLTLKVHCGGPYEDKTCTATVTAHCGVVELGPPEVESVGDGLDDLSLKRFASILGMPEGPAAPDA